MILIGPAGIGTPPLENLKSYNKLGFGAAEVEFVRNVYMNNETAKQIGEYASKLNISLSIHCPYAINLASEDKEKIEASKKRILDCCERGHYLAAKYIVFHAAYYGKRKPESVYDEVKEAVIEIQEKIKKNKWGVYLCPETSGKLSQFGTLEELKRLVKETNCGLCVDFAHIYARNLGKIDYDYVCREIKDIKILTAHFAGINFGPKGERNHLLTPEEEIIKLLTHLKKYNVNIRIISESPDPISDSLKTKKILHQL